MATRLHLLRKLLAGGPGSAPAADDPQYQTADTRGRTKGAGDSPGANWVVLSHLGLSGALLSATLSSLGTGGPSERAARVAPVPGAHQRPFLVSVD